MTYLQGDSVISNYLSTAHFKTDSIKLGNYSFQIRDGGLTITDNSASNNTGITYKNNLLSYSQSPSFNGTPSNNNSIINKGYVDGLDNQVNIKINNVDAKYEVSIDSLKKKINASDLSLTDLTNLLSLNILPK